MRSICSHWSLLLLLLVTMAAAAPAGADSTRQGLTALAERPPAPGFSLKDLDGKMHRLADYRGHVVIVNFWATWCPPCRREMPSMERASRKLADSGVVMLAVNVGEDLDTVFTFLADYSLSFPLLLDEQAAVVEQWPVRGLPTTFVVDPQGRIAYRAIGGREWDDPKLLQAITALQQGARQTTANAPPPPP